MLRLRTMELVASQLVETFAGEPTHKNVAVPEVNVVPTVDVFGPTAEAPVAIVPAVIQVYRLLPQKYCNPAVTAVCCHGLPTVPSVPIYKSVGPLVVNVAVPVLVGGVALNVPATVHRYTLFPAQ